jgi:hypothetical protein
MKQLKGIFTIANLLVCFSAQVTSLLAHIPCQNVLRDHHAPLDTSNVGTNPALTQIKNKNARHNPKQVSP